MRVAIVGNSGSGKTTLAQEVAEKTGATHIEIDAYFHLPGWEEKDGDLMRAELTAATEATEHWVADGNYRNRGGAIIRERADTIVFFDLPRTIVMKRVVGRTVRRAITRQELWNGNREPLTNFYRWDPERNIIRWSWVNHDTYSRQYRSAMTDGTWDHAEVVHVQRPDDAQEWLDGLELLVP
ncbi:MAG: AAA family ATPase [Actinomycetota bacterium]